MTRTLVALVACLAGGCSAIFPQMVAIGCGRHGCAQPEPAAAAEPTVEPVGFFCTSVICDRRKARCEAYRRKSGGSECVVAESAVCFGGVRGARFRLCFPTADGCQKQRALRDNRSDYRELSECFELE